MDKNAKIIVTGVKGQLGYDCLRRLNEDGFTNVLGIDIDDLDITDETAVNELILKERPEVVIHNAAWTAVDKAEQFEEQVYKVNALGPKYIAEACKKVDAKMIYISTDYVFNGKGENFFEVNDKKDGLSIYGKTKSQGEDFVKSSLDKYFIVRISWVFGINGNNFIKTMLKLADSGKTELNIVCDQIGSPTYTYDLANLLVEMIKTDKYGVYHATNEGVCSWAEFASYIFKTAKRNVKVNPITTEEYKKLVPSQADRPLNSRMSKTSLDEAGFSRLPSWKDAVDRYLKELEK
jgi:dTDP-4-dehydrorhamnose reductase